MLGNQLNKEMVLGMSLTLHILGMNSLGQRPDKNRVGINNSLIDDAFSVQKHKQAIIDCIKN